jgi:hypothetical protein
MDSASGSLKEALHRVVPPTGPLTAADQAVPTLALAAHDEITVSWNK